MKDRSLTRQIIMIVLTAQVLCALALAGFTLLREERAHLLAFDVRLQGRSDSLLGAIQDAEDVDASVRVDPEELRIPHQDVFGVYTRGGKLLGSSFHAPPVLITRGADGYRTVRVNDIQYRVLQREALRVIDRAEYGGVGLMRPVTILYASPETHVWHEIFTAVSYYLLAILVVAVSSMLLVGLFLQRALRPLSDLAVAASHIAVPALRFEPPQSALRMRELRPLAQVLMESVARLRSSFAKEQRFVGDAAHELKTAVAVVRSSIQVLMLKPRSAEEYAAGLNRVLEDNERVESLVINMLQLASITESNVQTVQPTDLSAVAAAVLSELEPLARDQRVTFRSTCSSTAMVLLTVDRARILVSNLLVNAIQHSAPGSVVLVSVQGEDSHEVVLRVIDRGSGISADALPLIFDRFYREDKSRSRETGGTGLGLSICKAIVDSAGGSIHAASSNDVGTTMTVVLRAA